MTSGVNGPSTVPPTSADVSRARGLSDSISGETEFLVDSGTFSAFVTQPVRRRGSVKAPSDGVPVDDSAGCTSVHSVQNGVHSGGADVGSMSSHSERYHRHDYM